MIAQLILLAGALVATFLGGYWIAIDKSDAKYRAILATKNSALLHIRNDRDRKAQQLEDLQQYLRRQHNG